MRLDLDHQRLWLIAAAFCWAIFSAAASHAAGLNDIATDLASAEQCYEEGNYLEASRILERMVGGKTGNDVPTPEMIAATRLLAQVYHRSADYEAAVRTADRCARMSPQVDPEVLFIMAESNLELKRYDDARRELDKLSALMKNQAAGSARQARLVIGAQRVAEALQRMGQGNSPKIGADHRGNSGAPQQIEILSSNYQEEQRFEVVTLTVNRALETNRVEDAIGLLSREIRSPAYDANESVDLKQQLADCYRRLARLSEETADSAAWRTARAAEKRTLDSLAVDLQILRKRSSEFTDFLKLLPREGTLHERQAELAQSAAQNKLGENAADSDASKRLQALAAEHLREAAARYQLLGYSARKLERAAQASQGAAVANGSHRSGLAREYRDLALCGLQRVYEAQRLASAGKTDQQLNAKLSEVSNSLVEEREKRLLDTDPDIYEAKRAQASVYASTDERDKQVKAETIYLGLLAKKSHLGADLQVAVLIGLAEVSRALDNTKQAYKYAREAYELADKLPVSDDPISRRDHAILMARIENSLGVASIALGDYRDALKHLTDADQQLVGNGDRVAELRRKNQEALLVLSRVKMYRALLHKAEAQYNDAVMRVEEGRRLREMLQTGKPSGADNGDLLTYYLAEASVRLAQARDLRERGLRQNELESQRASIDKALSQAEAVLANIQRLTGWTDDEDNDSQTSTARSYRYLRAVQMRMRGELAKASAKFLQLADQCKKHGDGKTEAKCYLQLAQLSMETSAAAYSKGAEATAGETAVVSRKQAEQLLRWKLRRRDEIAQAADYANRAVDLFKQKNGPSNEQAEDELTVTALPSLHFQASYLAARLQILLATADSHIASLNKLLTADASAVGKLDANKPSESEGPAERRRTAIRLLADAVEQAERPVNSTTQIRLQRAQFFSRDAPAYDLLVDLYVAAAVGQAETKQVDSSSKEFADICSAIKVADQARNRTFREQIDGWRRTAGKEPDSAVFAWNTLGQILDADTALLIYHLDGPQLLRGGNDIAPTGCGHLFVVLNQGQEIRYCRLRHKDADATKGSDFSRKEAIELVNRHVRWIEDPDSALDWDKTAQLALTECLLPREVIDRLRGRPTSAPPADRHPVQRSGKETASKSIRHLLIVTDGALNQLPFETLRLPDPKDSENDRTIHYVITDFPPIRYGPSLSVLAKINESGTDSNQAGDILTVGNPAYPDDTQQRRIPTWNELLGQNRGQAGGFVQLTHSEDECNSVYASFNELPAAHRTKLVQTAATEAAVRQHITTSRFIHIAAHGCVDYQNDNLFGALVLTPGPDIHDLNNDGLLQLREIYGLNFPNCELAVLSACQTNIGADRPLEAGTSMARAFLEQGAKRVVCSQWSTDDRATTELMKSFFDALRGARREGRKIEYDVALRQAKLAVRGGPEKTLPPRFWAPFVLVGGRNPQ